MDDFGSLTLVSLFSTTFYFSDRGSEDLIPTPKLDFEPLVAKVRYSLLFEAFFDFISCGSSISIIDKLIPTGSYKQDVGSSFLK